MAIQAMSEFSVQAAKAFEDRSRGHNKSWPSISQTSELSLPSPAKTGSTNLGFLRFDRSSRTRSYATIPEFESSGPLNLYETHLHSQRSAEAGWGPTTPSPMIPTLRSPKTPRVRASTSTGTTRSTHRSRGSESSISSAQTFFPLRIQTSQAARDFTAFKLRLDGRHAHQPSRDLPPFLGTRPLDPKQ